jgi:hypothetical protein
MNIRGGAVAASAAVVVLVGALAGCGGGADTEAACTKVKGEISSLTSGQGMDLNDPGSVVTRYHEAADNVRAAGKGTDISDEAEGVAAAFDKLAQQLDDFAANPSTTAPNLDQASLIAAGTKLQAACS